MTVMGFYWRSPQHETQLDVELILGIYDILSKTSTHLNNWWEPRNTKNPEIRLKFDKVSIRRKLLENLNRKDFSREGIQALGYKLSGWTPDVFASSLSFHLNVDPRWYQPNSFELSFKTDITQGELPFSRAMCIELFDNLISFIKPARATLTSFLWTDRLRSPLKENAVGWLTYSATPDATGRELNGPFISSPVADGIRIVGEGRISEITLENLQNVQDALGR